jgi:hypothetical protein
MPLKVSDMRPEAVAVLTDDRPIVDHRRTAAEKLFKNQDAYGSALLMAARTVLTYEELVSFDVETVRLELETEFSIKKMDEDIFGRLMAMLAAIDTDLFYNSLPAFIDICNILSGQAAAADIFDPADPFEIAWAVTEVGLMDPPDEDMPFSLEIREYMGFSLHEHGFFSPPTAMSMAIMPDSHLAPAQVTDDPELLPTIVQTDIERAAEVDAMLRENIAELAQQLRPFVASDESSQ